MKNSEERRLTKDERFNSLEMKAHIKTATTVVKKGVEQTEYVDLGVGG